MNRKELIDKCQNWWYCDNIVCHKGTIGLLHMGFPRCFIIVRDNMDMLCEFEEFRDSLAEVNFLTPSDREGADIEELLIDAYNFMILQEEEEDDMIADMEIDEALDY